MPPAARLGDLHVCPAFTGIVPHVGGPILPPCAPTVLVMGAPQAKVGDMCTCVGPPAPIVKGSAVVQVMGMPAARILDNTGHGGMILGPGALTVLIGDAPGAGGVGAMLDAAITAMADAVGMVAEAHEAAINLLQEEAQKTADGIVKLVQTTVEDPYAGLKMAASNLKKNVEKIGDKVGMGEETRRVTEKAQRAAENAENHIQKTSEFVQQVAETAKTDPAKAAEMLAENARRNAEKNVEMAKRIAGGEDITKPPSGGDGGDSGGSGYQGGGGESGGGGSSDQY